MSHLNDLTVRCHNCGTVLGINRLQKGGAEVITCIGCQERFQLIGDKAITIMKGVKKGFW